MSSKAPAAGVVIRETPEMPLSKKKEKIAIEKYKGIDLLSEVALTEEAQFEEIKPSVTNEGTGVKPGVPGVIEEESSKNKDSGDDNTQSDSEKGSDSEHETDENESDSKSDQEENEEEIGDDEEEEEDEFVRTLSNDSDDDTNFSNKAKEGIDAELTNIQQGNENLEISQVIEDAYVTLSTVPQKTEVLVISSSHSSDLASKFLNFSDIPHTDVEIVSPVDVHVHHEVPSKKTPTLLTVPISVITESSPIYSIVIPQSIPSFTPPPSQSTPIPPPTTKATNLPSILLDFVLVFQFNNRVTTLEKEVVELKKDDPLKTQVTALVDEHLDARLTATRDEFMNFLLASITARITKQVKNQPPQILPKEVSNFAPSVIQSMITESLDHAILAKESSQP
nr:hypothetical protein [Tanacetum cinerariifolium]